VHDQRAVTRTGGGSAAPLAEEALDDPVFEAVEGDDGEPAARLQRALCGFESLFELVELGVQVNPDRLESARGWIALLTGTEAGSATDDRRELGGALDRTCGNDGAGDRPGARLLPIVAGPG